MGGTDKNGTINYFWCFKRCQRLIFIKPGHTFQKKKKILSKVSITVHNKRGITKDLTDKHNAVELVKVASKIIGGKGGGGRKDFAQAGGSDKDKIEDAFNAVSKKIN